MLAFFFWAVHVNVPEYFGQLPVYAIAFLSDLVKQEYGKTVSVFILQVL